MHLDAAIWSQMQLDERFRHTYFGIKAWVKAKFTPEDTKFSMGYYGLPNSVYWVSLYLYFLADRSFIIPNPLWKHQINQNKTPDCSEHMANRMISERSPATIFTDFFSWLRKWNTPPNLEGQLPGVPEKQVRPPKHDRWVDVVLPMIEDANRHIENGLMDELFRREPLSIKANGQRNSFCSPSTSASTSASSGSESGTPPPPLPVEPAINRTRPTEEVIVLPTGGRITSIAFPTLQELDNTTCTCRTISPKLQALANAFPGHIRLTENPCADFNFDLYELHNDLPAAEVYARAFVEFWKVNRKIGCQPCIIAQTRHSSPNHKNLVSMLDRLAREPQYSDCVFWVFGKTHRQDSRPAVSGKVLQLCVTDLTQFSQGSHEAKHCNNVANKVPAMLKLKPCPGNIVEKGTA